MKKSIITAMMLMLIAITGDCQLLTANDTLALKIPEQDTYSTNGISEYVKAHFASESDRIRALFVWVANNISYDLEKLRSQKRVESTTTDDVLKMRKGICQDYSELFVELCNNCNITSILVPGYSKRPDGSISDLSHAWVAAKVNNKWCLFDPTWSAGGVNKDHFISRFSNRYYKVLPEEMIGSHMPFDPMYQFLNYPVSYNEFNRGKTEINTSKSFFNFTDTLNQYNSLALINQIRGTARRIQKNGERNEQVEKRLIFLIKQQESHVTKVGYDGAAHEYNQAIALFNRYIQNKNTRFSSIKENNQIQQMIDKVLQHLKKAKGMLALVVADNEEHRQLLFKNNNSLLEFKNRVDKENAFLKKYLQTDKSSRKT